MTEGENNNDDKNRFRESERERKYETGRKKIRTRASGVNGTSSTLRRDTSARLLGKTNAKLSFAFPLGYAYVIFLNYTLYSIGS